MSKHRHNKYIDTIDECLTSGVNNGIFQISFEDDSFNGRTVKTGGREVVNFGSCSYLGLEMDKRIREAGKIAFDNYGAQFSTSRLFASCGLYKTAEELLSEMFFNLPVIISPTTTLAHIAAIPILVEDDDLVILDHQAHGSMQMAVQLPKSRGVPIKMIHHNNLAELEQLLIENKDKYSKIWYFIDGLYSMYGDYAPLKELVRLLNKYEYFYLYADDAHGMSWTGKNGTGYLLSQIQMHPRMVLTTSLNKAYATGGGLLVLPNEELKRKIVTCGTSFTFSGPLQPPTLGAIVASAQIHLSEEIYTYQKQLNERTKYALHLINENNLPILAPNESPIFYLALGLPGVGYKMVKHLLNEGFYTNIGIFPGVPVKCSGLRLAISNGQTMEDIKNVIDAFKYHFPKVLEEESQSVEDLSNNFNVSFKKTAIAYPLKIKENESGLNIQLETTIKNINKSLWDDLLGDNGSFDWNGCLFLEESFKDNPEPENNWKFYYLILKDEKDLPVLATFFTELLCKDDMISPDIVSIKIEEQRQRDKYYLTSKVIMMGSLLTEGDHLYLNRNNKNWKSAMLRMLAIMNEIKINSSSKGIQLRDFDSLDEEMKDFLIKEGFIKVEMPDTHLINDLTWDSEENFLKTLSSNSRKKINKSVFRFSNYFKVSIIENSNVTENKIKEWYKMYINVKNKSYHLNTFQLPLRLFSKIVDDPNWEIIELKPIGNENETCSVMFCYKSSKKNYIPMIIGLNYKYVYEFGSYRQSLFQTIIRARNLEFNKVYLGMGASIEKKKFGATLIPKSNFMQYNENFNFALINSI